MGLSATREVGAGVGGLSGGSLTGFGRRRRNPSAGSGQVLPLPLARVKSGAACSRLHPNVVAGADGHPHPSLLPQGDLCVTPGWLPGRPSPQPSPRGRGRKSSPESDGQGRFARVSGEGEERCGLYLMASEGGWWGSVGARRTAHRFRPRTAESFGKLRTGSASFLGEGEEAICLGNAPGLLEGWVRGRGRFETGPYARGARWLCGGSLTDFGRGRLGPSAGFGAGSASFLGGGEERCGLDLMASEGGCLLG